MQNGITIDLAADTLDRLVFRKSELDEVAQEAGSFLIKTNNGERLLARAERGLQIHVSTRIGAFDIPVDALRGIVPMEDEEPGYWVHLVNQTVIRGFLTGPPLRLQNPLFGEIEIEPQQISSLQLHGSAALDDEQELHRAHMILRGGDRIVGVIDLPAITFSIFGGRFPIPPLQLEQLISTNDDPSRTDQPMMFEATIWGGGVIQGEIEQALLPLKAELIGTVDIPLRLVQEFRVPAPSLPEAVRKRIVKLVGKLGDADWQQRESAHSDLVAFGALAREPLAEALRRVEDPEAERRINRILSEIGD